MLYKKENKTGQKPLFTAADFLASKNIKLQLPKTAILAPAGNLCSTIEGFSQKRYNLFGNIDILSPNLAFVSGYGLGAPMTAIMLEILAALGVEQFILLGTAGALANTLNAADIVLCTQAVCDEGVSKDYTNRTLAEADESLINILKTVLPTAKTGKSWTTSSLFRETAAETAYYAQAGITTVEMEAATLFSIAQAKNLKAAAVFVISDLLADNKWEPCFTNKKIRANLIDIIKKLNAYYNKN